MRSEIIDNLRYITPEGTKDYIFEEAIALRGAEKRLSDILTQHKYREIITPGIEFYSLFNSGNKLFAPESIYRFTDEKGRMLALRRDCTLPIARLAATRLKNEPYPLRLYYNQNIFISERKDFGALDELYQSGAELIGYGGYDADIELLSLAMECIKGLGITDYRFEIGDTRFFNLLSANIPENDIELLRDYAEKKSYHSIDYPEIRELATLFGGAEILPRAEILFASNRDCVEVLDGFKRIYYSGVSDFSVDLCQPKLPRYYTGLVFHVYASGHGTPILSGGRYDNLLSDFGKNTPAIGFAVNLNAVIKLSLSEK